MGQQVVDCQPLNKTDFCGYVSVTGQCSECGSTEPNLVAATEGPGGDKLPVRRQPASRAHARLER